MGLLSLARPIYEKSLFADKGEGRAPNSAVYGAPEVEESGPLFCIVLP